MDEIELKAGDMTARIVPLGAELRSLTVGGADVIWTPDAAFWDGTCSILFPVIGRVNGDLIRVDGAEYPMPMHGFALTSCFSSVEYSGDRCTLELRSSHATRLHYPYDFTIKLTYQLTGSTLEIAAEIRNDGDVPLPASFGLHPGFRWPLIAGIPKQRHFITFDEVAPIFYTRPVDRLIGPTRTELPLGGKSLRLDEALFETGGMALLSLKSRSLYFHTDNDKAAIRLDFPDMSGVILWSRPGGDFLCIEPLFGHADPIGFSGDLMEKPGMAHVEPGRTLTLTVAITPEFSPA